MMMSAIPVEVDRRNWITGLEKGLAIIQAYDVENTRMSATEVAKRTGMTRSAARRHLMMFTYLGYMATDGKSFWLQPKVLRLGSAYLYSARLPRIVQPFLQRLSLATQENSFMALLDEGELVYVARNGTNRFMNAGVAPGVRLSPFLTAPGIAIMSTLPVGQCEQMIADYQVMPFTQHTLTDKAAILATIHQASRDGFAVMEQQLELGIRGIGVPLKNHKAETVGAISLNMNIGNEPLASAITRALPSLQQIAAELRNLV